jgi:hypothetical protein
MMFTYIVRMSLILLWLLAAVANAATASPSIDLSQYTEISPDSSLPRIFAGLRRTLKDPGSISDFALCSQPRKVKFKDGKPVRWTYLFSLNARNGMGGYMGLQPYAAILHADGRTTIDSLTMPGNEGFSKLGNDLIERDMARCPYLPKDKLRELLEQSQ